MAPGTERVQGAYRVVKTLYTRRNIAPTSCISGLNLWTGRITSFHFVWVHSTVIPAVGIHMKNKIAVNNTSGLYIWWQINNIFSMEIIVCVFIFCCDALYTASSCSSSHYTAPWLHGKYHSDDVVTVVSVAVTTGQWLHRTHVALGIHYLGAHVEIWLLGT